jgi:hypothetical protein
MFAIQLKTKKIACLSFFVFAAALTGCATGKPLALADLDRIGWENTSSFQYYLSSQLTLTKLPDDSILTDIYFDAEGEAHIRGDSRGTIVLPSSLEGRILRYNKKDQYLYMAFEEGDVVLPFARDKNGQFSLMPTINSNDQKGIEFVEYDGGRYRLNFKPHLNVVINETQADLRRQMGGSQVRSTLNTEEVAGRISEKFIGDLPERSVIAVLNISSSDKETADFIMGELEVRLTDSKKFRMVDRKFLDTIRLEQQFQLSGEVSDESACSIGNMLGANIVITGSISGTGSSRRLTLKALDVETAVIISTVREAF